MNKQLMKWTVASAIVMWLIPLSVVIFATDAGMALCFILFFAVNPIYFFALGYITAKDIKRLWPLPLVSAAMFITGVWVLFTMSEPLFMLYTFVYLGLSAAAITVSRCLSNYSRRKQHD